LRQALLTLSLSAGSRASPSREMLPGSMLWALWAGLGAMRAF